MRCVLLEYLDFAYDYMTVNNGAITLFTGCIHHPALFLPIILCRYLIPIQFLVPILVLVLALAAFLKPGAAAAASWRTVTAAHPFSTWNSN